MGSRENMVHKQEVVDFLNLNFTHLDPENEILACFRETFDYWPEENGLDVEMPGFRATDPDTSRRAAFEAIPRAKSQRMKVLEEFKQLQIGMTHHEVEFATGVPSAWKRISELRQGGWLKDSGQERRDEKTGSFCTVWVLTDKAKEAKI